VNNILAGYAAASADLIARLEAISSRDVYTHVLDLLPDCSGRVADVGAGTGRDGAWFAEQGHYVLAIEPVEELRNAGISQHPSPRIEWLDDRLPTLTIAKGWGVFDLVTLCAVWQHINEADRRLAIENVSQMVKVGGLIIMSLRHGPGAQDRPVFPISVDAVINAASSCGFKLLRRTEAASVQVGNRASGVHWTWLALRRVR
jgi:SAM-dependent methyltransferase